MAIRHIDHLDDAAVRVSPELILRAPAPAPSDRATRSAWFDDTGWVMPTGGFLVREGSQVILVDAGTGPSVPADIGEQLGESVTMLHSGRLVQSLAEVGVTPDDVTDVVLTHLHSDHVGWIAPDGAPVFAHARHHCHQADLRWLSSLDNLGPATLGVPEVIDAIRDLLTVVEGDRAVVSSSVTLRLAAGHTPGNCIVEVDTIAGPVLLLGDTAHHPALLVEPGWTDLADEDHDDAARARAWVSAEMERTGAVGWGAHFPGRHGGRISRDGNGFRRWQPVDDGPPSGDTGRDDAGCRP